LVPSKLETAALVGLVSLLGLPFIIQVAVAVGNTLPSAAQTVQVQAAAVAGVAGN
jgi:hypothetical protein